VQIDAKNRFLPQVFPVTSPAALRVSSFVHCAAAVPANPKPAIRAIAATPNILFITFLSDS
jgi:hypothetical protein